MIVLALVITGAGISAVFASGLLQSSVQQSASTSQTSFSTASVKQTSVITVTASNGPGGCGPSSTTTSSEGYNLTVYHSSSSLTIGDTECISALMLVASGIPVPANQSGDFSLTFTVTDSHGNVVAKSIPCVPAGSVGAPSPGFECGFDWATGELVNGASLTPGAYHIDVTGSFIGRAVSTPVTISNEVDVTLSAV